MYYNIYIYIFIIFNPQITLEDRQYHYSHFTEEETGAKSDRVQNQRHKRLNLEPLLFARILIWFL